MSPIEVIFANPDLELILSVTPVAPEECLRQLKLKKGPRPKQRPKGLFGASYVQGTIVVTLFSLCMHMQSR